MPLVLEDGTGVAGANTYNEVADADAFFTDRNIIDWAGAGATEPEKEGFLIQGADHLNQFYSPRGEILVEGQGMAFPTDVYGYVPWQAKQAQLLLAREAAINPPLSTTFGEKVVTSIREQLAGVGETETHYDTETTKADAVGRVGSAVDALMEPFVHRAGSSFEQARVELG